MPQPDLARTIRREAARLGFCAVGFSAPVPPAEAVHRYRAMLDEHRHGEMHWMEEALAGREEPERLLAGIKTVISLALSYNHPLERPSGQARISRYALADDYHRVIKARIGELLEAIREIAGPGVEGLAAVDSSPLLERAWAQNAGFGRTGKNALLIIPSAGSFVFLGELLLTLEVRDERPALPNLCGACTNCQQSCPTGAITAPGTIDARRCISYLTVELKRDFTPEEAAMIGLNLYGCDHCQECCPHNARTSIPADPAFTPRPELLSIDPEEILAMNRSQFRRLFAGTPVIRTGLRRLKRNARAVLANRDRELPQQSDDSNS